MSPPELDQPAVVQRAMSMLIDRMVPHGYRFSRLAMFRKPRIQLEDSLSARSCA
ncbi:MAG: hypothetical protein OXC41_09110 [Gammaproteobacteria bacterium]|nr:hypothetical protein [Gammaproteobacteria bacterium]